MEKNYDNFIFHFKCEQSGVAKLAQSAELGSLDLGVVSSSLMLEIKIPLKKLLNVNNWKHTSVAVDIIYLTLLDSKGRKPYPGSEISFLISQSLCRHCCSKIFRSVTEKGNIFSVFRSIHIWTERWGSCSSWRNCVSILLPLDNSLEAQRFPQMFPSQIYYFISGIFPSHFRSNLFAFNQFHASVAMLRINYFNIILKLR